MKNLDDNTPYRYYILLIVFSYILPHSILYLGGRQWLSLLAACGGKDV
jgi:hypothetical protein